MPSRHIVSRQSQQTSYADRIYIRLYWPNGLAFEQHASKFFCTTVLLRQAVLAQNIAWAGQSQPAYSSITKFLNIALSSGILQHPNCNMLLIRLIRIVLDLGCPTSPCMTYDEVSSTSRHQRLIMSITAGLNPTLT